MSRLFSLVAGSRGYSLAVVHRLLSAEASLLAEHWLEGTQASQCKGFSSRGALARGYTGFSAQRLLFSWSTGSKVHKLLSAEASLLAERWLEGTQASQCRGFSSRGALARGYTGSAVVAYRLRSTSSVSETHV